MNIKRNDIEIAIHKFKTQTKADHRFASFDYCYNYFKNTSPEKIQSQMETSCLTLGFYLASWGMFRGSSFMLKKSARHFVPTINCLADIDRNAWNIDVDNYSAKNIATIINTYDKVKEALIQESNADLTLVSKVLMGIFGFIPAYDTYFTSTFRRLFRNKCGFCRVNVQSLDRIREFYEANSSVIDRLATKTKTIDFATGKPTNIEYPKAKIIDMYGFIFGSKS